MLVSLDKKYFIKKWNSTNTYQTTEQNLLFQHLFKKFF